MDFFTFSNGLNGLNYDAADFLRDADESPKESVTFLKSGDMAIKIYGQYLNMSACEQHLIKSAYKQYLIKPAYKKYLIKSAYKKYLNKSALYYKRCTNVNPFEDASRNPHWGKALQLLWWC